MFKVGQTVWCVLFGKGKVVRFDDGVDFPVIVEFEANEIVRSYTNDGRYYPSYSRTLFFSEPKIEADTEPPFVSELIGKKVVVNYGTSRNREWFGGTVVSETKTSIEVKSTGEGTVFVKDKVDIYLLPETPYTYS